MANIGIDQGSSAAADKQQMIDLATAGSAYLLASAQADKTARLNQLNDVSNWQDIYKKAMADARLTLTDSQADADQTWIDGKAAADETFLTSDAGSWQSMIDAEAQTNNQLAHEQDDEAGATKGDRSNIDGSR